MPPMMPHMMPHMMPRMPHMPHMPRMPHMPPMNGRMRRQIDQGFNGILLFVVVVNIAYVVVSYVIPDWISKVFAWIRDRVSKVVASLEGQTNVLAPSTVKSGAPAPNTGEKDKRTETARMIILVMSLCVALSKIVRLIIVILAKSKGVSTTTLTLKLFTFSLSVGSLIVSYTSLPDDSWTLKSKEVAVFIFTILFLIINLGEMVNDLGKRMKWDKHVRSVFRSRMMPR